jgi:FkbM family methyltransferase
MYSAVGGPTAAKNRRVWRAPRARFTGAGTAAETSRRKPLPSHAVPDLLTGARGAFYRLDGPWYRRGLFEALGSPRYSRPALHGMDRRLEEVLPFDHGTFIEAGAHDGYTQSNTYFLERHRGWSGVLVEPIAELHRKAARRRPRSRVVHAALVAPEQDGHPVTVQFGDLQSQVGDDPRHAAGGLANAGRSGYTVQVPGRTLSSILDEMDRSRFDLLALDVEGHEYDALRGLDLERHVVEWMLIEMLDLPRQRPAFDTLLGERYAFVEALSPDDALYRRQS